MRIMLAAMLVAASLSTAGAEDDRESAFRGKRLAEANCAGCHAIAQFDQSPLAEAPALRDIGAATAPGELRRMLRGPVFSAHAIMPDFEPDDEQAEDLAAYILSLIEEWRARSTGGRSEHEHAALGL